MQRALAMDQLTYFNTALDYIETHLTQPLALTELARVAGYSRFHFDRRFAALIGETPACYLRKRRLSAAAQELVTSRKPILEIAFDYQFASQEAFTRAFQRMFRLSPGAYRRRRQLTRTFAKITLTQRKLYRIRQPTLTQAAPQLSQPLTTLSLPRQTILVCRFSLALISPF